MEICYIRDEPANLSGSREYGGMIKTESDRLTALINNILEMSRLERGIRKYRMEEGDLREIVSETVDVFQHSLDNREI